jgi:PilZ domain
MPQPDSSHPGYVPRAPRYAVQMPIQYRLLGSSAWRDGTTENISRSGVLFRCARVLEHSTWLEMNLSLPAEIAGERAANVICRGRIVRAIVPAAGCRRNHRRIRFRAYTGISRIVITCAIDYSEPRVLWLWRTVCPATVCRAA